MRRLLILALFLLPSLAWADYTCTVPTDGTFAQCVAACDGKTGVVTIDVTGATATWVHVDMSAWEADSVVIKGAGKDTTTMTIPALTNDIFLTAKVSIPFEIYGFNFDQPIIDNIIITGVPYSFKIHDNRFPQASGDGATVWIETQGGTTHPYGVVYSNELWKVAVAGSDTDGGGDNTNTVYAQQPAFGDAVTPANGVVYVEGNTYPEKNPAVGGYFTDGNDSSRFVFRFNTLTETTSGSVLAVHSINNQVPFMRGAQIWEIYNNDFTSTVYSYRWMNMRSGTGLIWNNKITTSSGMGSFIVFDNVRSAYASTILAPQGMCRGASTWDENLVIDSSLSVNTAKYGSTTFSGTHTGNGGDCTDNCATLVDSAKAWTASSFVRATPWAGATVWNTTDGSKCEITANDGTSITCTLAGGTDNNWDIGDEYRISNGYPCRDQIGRYYDIGGWDNDPVQANETQGFQPAYIWGNTLGGAAKNTVTLGTGNNTSHIVGNRDYYTAQGAACEAGGACTTGVGSGLAANKPTTCTPYTGFYATDENKFYQCSSEDTWTLLYTPETCPHPLTGYAGTCDYTKFGTAGYPTEGPVTPPDTTAPTVTADIPTGTISYTTSTILVATTDEPATCRYHASSTTWGDMAEMSGTGETSHTQSVNVSVGANSFKVVCQDPTTNESDADTWSFTVAEYVAPTAGVMSMDYTGVGGVVSIGSGGTITLGE